MEFGELSENPFSLEKTPASQKRGAFVSAIKFLLFVAVCLGATVVVSSQSRRWLVQHLTADFDSLNTKQKQTRLIQLADLGLPGIEPLVDALADDQIQVARTAFDLLQEAQNQWTALDRDDQQQRHHALIDSLETIAVHLPDDRTGWGTSLLQQTVLATVSRKDSASRNLYRSANHAIDLLSLSNRAGPSVLSAQPLSSSQPRRLTVRQKPLSISGVGQSESWTDWPPTQPQSSPTGAKIVARSSSPANRSTVEGPSVYRSGRTAKLRRADTDRPVQLRDVAQSPEIQGPEIQSQKSQHLETSYATNPIRSVAHVVDSPMETLDDQSVMQWLDSPHTAMREQAKNELVSRGYDETQIAIATQIAVGDTPARLALVDAISRSTQIDPRPWLFMLLGDENRQVKLRTISVLATMKDAYVDQRLRKRLNEESDTKVASQIRRVLELR